MEKEKKAETEENHDKEEMEFKDRENGGQEEEQKEAIGDEVERSKIGIMRALAEREDPSAKDADDFMIRRFLRARDLDIEKATTMFLKYLSWRRTFLPKGFISESEISTQLADNKLCMQGVDKQGRPIVVAFGGRHKPTKGNLEEVKRFVVYGLEKICAKMPKGQEKFVAIGDLEGWGFSNSDIRAYLASLSILQDCYPERLGKLIIVHVPYIFMTAWKVVYPFIDSRTKKKIVFVENKKLKSALLEDIDESQLPDIYGGKLPLVPIEEC
ncbi:Sec14p-like phosphatidylinositol transfer family protein isoform 2 [Hibiscus syriacus]|uniref:Sec14p-like phosphatidylinositol transfer family protein isoform 2 n=1 Tax=Hibiscus syriacus TaxID=106335 RepID=A0A6A3AIE0_HIBSY|nr:phosphatidylinositol transfer protein 3-like [Hibiscus syriacus]KAE8703065.1 Sec14p-like phosphatidylinositol transfer family protein isoform 2 [Hibiscus syriacus]